MLHVPTQGRLVLLMGPPGSGKSVFLKALGGRLKPSAELRTSGTVRYNGQPFSPFWSCCWGIANRIPNNYLKSNAFTLNAFALANLTL